MTLHQPNPFEFPDSTDFQQKQQVYTRYCLARYLAHNLYQLWAINVYTHVNGTVSRVLTGRQEKAWRRFPEFRGAR